MKIAILDWSCVTRSILSALPKKTIPWTRRTEAEELAHRVCEWVYSLYNEHKWDKVAIAMDSSPYWRHKFMQDWYQQNALVKEFGGAVYLDFDGAYHLAEVEGESVTLTKQNAASNKKIEAEGEAIDYPEGWPKPRFIGYKGNRAKRTWVNETSQEDFKKIQIGLAHRIAPLVNGHVVAIPECEADDIASMGAIAYKYDELLLISADGDWKQVFRGHHNSLFHNLYNNTRLAWSLELKEQVREQLMLKIIGGESGDCIKGCPRLDRKGWSCVGDKAKEYIANNELHLLDARYIRRNQKLIEMGQKNLPEDLANKILFELGYAKKVTELPTFGWEDLGLTAREQEYLKLEANSNRVFAQWFSKDQQISDMLGTEQQ